VARYHSLAIIEGTLNDDFEITAKTDDGEIMGIRHKEYKLIGLQFHPESIYTPEGLKMIENFINL
jgi:anthranilate synthase component 2